MSPTDIMLLLLAIVGGTASWWYLSGTYEVVLVAARRHCQTMGVQFLDATVSRSGYGLTKSAGGNIGLLQKFSFEFSTLGDTRYQGRATAVGKRVVSIELEAHRVD